MWVVWVVRNAAQQTIQLLYQDWAEHTQSKSVAVVRQ